jgi:hypothetical protein
MEKTIFVVCLFCPRSTVLLHDSAVRGARYRVAHIVLGLLLSLLLINVWVVNIDTLRLLFFVFESV